MHYTGKPKYQMNGSVEEGITFWKPVQNILYTSLSPYINIPWYNIYSSFSGWKLQMTTENGKEIYLWFFLTLSHKMADKSMKEKNKNLRAVFLL